MSNFCCTTAFYRGSRDCCYYPEIDSGLGFSDNWFLVQIIDGSLRKNKFHGILHVLNQRA